MPKSKLGNNPLATRGVDALFSESSDSKSTPKAVVAQGAKLNRKPKSRVNSSVSQLVNKVTNPSTDDADFERHTFYLTESQGQKVKLYALMHRMQISEVVRMLIDNHLKIQP